MRRVGLSLLAVSCSLLAPAALEARVPLDKPPPSAPDRSRPEPHKAPDRNPAEPHKPPPKGGGSSSTAWLDTVDAVCDEGLKERQALLADVSRNPSSTARNTLLRILTGTGLIEDRMLSQLAKIRPPQADRAAFDGAVRLFRDRHAEDKRLISSLRRGRDSP